MDKEKINQLSDKNILIISPDLWTELYVSKHHYARYLSKNNTVWFLNALGDVNLSEKVSIRKHGDYNIFIINYKPIVRGISKLPSFILNILLKYQIKILKKNIKEPIDIIWTFDPNRFWNLDYWNIKTKIYHTVDFHYKARFESTVCKTADIVLCVADLILDPIKKYNSNIHKINHGVDHLMYESNRKDIKLPGSNKIKAGYLGNFHRDINYKLLLELSKRNSNVDFIMMGPHKGKDMGALKITNDDYTQLASQKNVFFIGKISSDDISSHLSLMDINLLMFKDNALVKHCNPHKVLFYLLSGKVIISNVIDEYKNSELLELVNTDEDYISKFNLIVNNIDLYNNLTLIDKRKSFALDNTYEKQINRICSLLTKSNQK